MTDLFNKLDRRFNCEIKLVQFAFDGNWEQAWIIEKSNIPPEASKLETFLQNKFKNFACEVFFEDTANIHIFWGIRYIRDEDNLLECYQFISQLFAALSQESRGVASLIAKISQELGSISLLSSEPSHIEVGVVDFWKSCGSVVLWQQDEPKQLSETLIREKLQTNKQLICTALNYQAIEFAFEGEYSHWLGIQVGKTKNGIYKTDINSLIGFAVELFGFESLTA